MNPILRFIARELGRPYAWPGIIMGLALLLLIGGVLYKASVWAATYFMGWWG